MNARLKYPNDSNPEFLPAEPFRRGLGVASTPRNSAMDIRGESYNKPKG